MLETFCIRKIIHSEYKHVVYAVNAQLDPSKSLQTKGAITEDTHLIITTMTIVGYDISSSQCKNAICIVTVVNNVQVILWFTFMNDVN
jgi:hypothetical protein